MATVMVGSARIDERGKAYGGKAGDQTGKEVGRQKWYLHRKGWRVFRAKNAARAAMIARAMRDACDNPNIGYDQWQRNTLYAQAEKVGFDVARVKTACETDCSALVRVCCAFAGIFGLPPDFRTGNMPANLLATSAFVELKGAKYTDSSRYLGAGDILVTRTSGHTVVVLNDGPMCEGSVVPEEAALGGRLLKQGREGGDVRQLQAYLIQLGYDLGKWGADGDFGDATELAVRAFQRDSGLTVDGQYGPKSHAAMLEALERDEAGAPEPRKAVIDGGDCWIRAAPGADGERLGVARRGSTLPYGGVTTDDGWLLVEYEGRNAWVSGKYGRVSG